MCEFQDAAYRKVLGSKGFFFVPLHMLMFSFLDANCEVLSNLFHSLDIWHKSIKLTAKISSVCTRFLLFVTINNELIKPF